MGVKIYNYIFGAKRELFCELLLTYANFVTTAAGFILVFVNMLRT